MLFLLFVIVAIDSHQQNFKSHRESNPNDSPPRDPRIGGPLGGVSVAPPLEDTRK